MMWKLYKQLTMHFSCTYILVLRYFWGYNAQLASDVFFCSYILRFIKKEANHMVLITLFIIKFNQVLRTIKSSRSRTNFESISYKFYPAILKPLFRILSFPKVQSTQSKTPIPNITVLRATSRQIQRHSRGARFRRATARRALIRHARTITP